MRVLTVHLHHSGFSGAEAWIESAYDIYHGDQLALGKGEILLRA